MVCLAGMDYWANLVRAGGLANLRLQHLHYFRVARYPKDALLIHLRPGHFTLKPPRCALPRKVEAEARRVLRIKLIQSAAGEWETASMPPSVRARESHARARRPPT